MEITVWLINTQDIYLFFKKKEFIFIFNIKILFNVTIEQYQNIVFLSVYGVNFLTKIQ